MFEPVSRQGDERLWRRNLMSPQHRWMYHRIRRGWQMAHPLRIPGITLAFVHTVFFFSPCRLTDTRSLLIGLELSTFLFDAAVPAISEALRPYAAASVLMDGKIDSNKAPSRLAVRCTGPCSAFSTLRRDRELRRPRYSAGASTLIREKSTLKLARPRLISLVADTAEAAILPMAAIEHSSGLFLIFSGASLMECQKAQSPSVIPSPGSNDRVHEIFESDKTLGLSPVSLVPLRRGA